MKKKTNLKAVSNAKPEKMTYREIERFAAGIAESCMEADDFLPSALMILAREIIEHCYDSTHVETVAMILADKLYATTRDCAAAQERYVASEREKWMKGGEG